VTRSTSLYPNGIMSSSRTKGSRPFSYLCIEWTGPSTHTKCLSSLRVGQIPVNQMVHVNLHGYVVTLREVWGYIGVTQALKSHVFQMNSMIDPLRFIPLNKNHTALNEHTLKVQTRSRNVYHYGSAWSCA
jgi:hypothetical protein